MDSDIRVVKKVIHGEIQCFEELVLKYEAKIYRTSYKFVKNEQDARDITQEVFIKVYNNLTCYREYSKFSTWIYKITVNTCLNFLRKKDLLTMSFNDEIYDGSQKLNMAGEHNAGEYNNPEGIVMAKEVKELLETELDGFDERERSISDYRLNYGMPFKKIADKIGGTAASARMSFYRTRKKLAGRLEQYYKGE